MHLSEHTSFQVLHSFNAASASGNFSFIFRITSRLYSLIFFLILSLAFFFILLVCNFCRTFADNFSLILLQHFNPLFYPHISLFLFSFHSVACLQIARIYRAVQFCKRYFQIYEKQRKSYKRKNLFYSIFLENKFLCFYHFYFLLIFFFSFLIIILHLYIYTMEKTKSI